MFSLEHTRAELQLLSFDVERLELREVVFWSGSQTLGLAVDVRSNFHSCLVWSTTESVGLQM